MRFDVVAVERDLRLRKVGQRALEERLGHVLAHLADLRRVAAVHLKARTVASGWASSLSKRSRWRSVRFAGRLSHMYRVFASSSRWCFDSSRRTSSTAFERCDRTW